MALKTEAIALPSVVNKPDGIMFPVKQPVRIAAVLMLPSALKTGATQVLAAFAGFRRTPSSAVPTMPSGPRKRKEKSPNLSACVGRLRFTGAESCRMRLYSWPTKKKNLSFLIGPLKFQPKLLKRSFAFTGEKKLRASSLSLRRNSKAVPCYELPPPRVTVFTDGPALRPYSAV